MTDRPKVGPADPETRRKALRAALDAPTKGTGVAAKAAPPAKKRKTLTLGDALNPRVKRESAHSGESVMDVVDKAVKGAKPDPY
jgi:hypothetical protein